MKIFAGKNVYILIAIPIFLVLLLCGVIFVEQIYCAMTIIKHKPYLHD